ncbi:MAG TPA: hypothetical protein VE935_02530 [Burkholderiales bacterium]|nr:hypothetical protein [Burkholderiales bacterium]
MLPEKATPAPVLPKLELSGPKLALALETLVSRADDLGGIEAFVEGLKAKAALFQQALVIELTLKSFRTLCAHMATVRRRVGPYAQPDAFPSVKKHVEELFSDADSPDARVGRFCARFPEDREHRWVRDLAAELLHFADPERYPLMTRWVWDVRTNTGVLREIWHGEEVDHMTIDVADDHATFLGLRQELAQYLQTNGVYRDVLFYTDILLAQIYAGYIGERAGSYLRTDFATPEDPMLHTRRILGLDGVDERGKTRLKAADGRAEVIP